MKSKEMKNIPTLRFPEFLNDGEWGEKPLSKLLTIGSGRDYKHLSNGDIPVYGTGGHMLSVDDYLYDGESVCIGRKGTIDKPMFLTGKFWTVDTLFYTHSFEDCIPKYIYYYFGTINWYDYNEAGGVPSLSKTTINKINIPIPPNPNNDLKEQQKIANCLSSIDNLITAQSKKVEALKEHKKGLMQQLFPTDGKKVPKLRFPEFLNDGEWEEKYLSEIIDFKSGYAFSSSRMSNEVQQYQLIKMSNVYQNNLALDRNPSYWEKINQRESEFLLETGDVVLTLTGTIGKKDYGYSAVIEENNKFLLNQRLVRLRAINERSLSKFIRNLVLHENFLDCFFINSRGGTGNQSNVSIEDLKQIKLPIPERQEQQKIADCLSSIDNLITAQSKKVETLKEHKKGLMQQLFPSKEVK